MIVGSKSAWIILFVSPFRCCKPPHPLNFKFSTCKRLSSSSRWKRNMVVGVQIAIASLNWLPTCTRPNLNGTTLTFFLRDAKRNSNGGKCITVGESELKRCFTATCRCFHKRNIGTDPTAASLCATSHVKVYTTRTPEECYRNRAIEALLVTPRSRCPISIPSNAASLSAINTSTVPAL